MLGDSGSSDWSDSGRTNLKSGQGQKKSSGPSDLIRTMYPISNLASLKRGGKVRKTGPANLHAGERVIPKSKVKRVEKMMRSKNMRLKDSKR